MTGFFRHGCESTNLTRHPIPSLRTRIRDRGVENLAILLPMQEDPMEEWRRLTALYGEMGDIEIRELTSQINNLMPIAQQILRDELKKQTAAN